LAGILLGGWATNGFVTVQTGLPFTPGLQTSTTNGNGQPSDGLRDSTLPSDQRTLQRWFDTSFQTPGATVSNPAFGTPALTLRQVLPDTLFGPGRVTRLVAHQGFQVQ